jgi:hypothetical protein
MSFHFSRLLVFAINVLPLSMLSPLSICIGTFKNSAVDGSVFDYWPLQAEWPYQQDEIALGSNTLDKETASHFICTYPSLAQKRQKVFRKPILETGQGKHLGIISFWYSEVRYVKKKVLYKSLKFLYLHVF